MQNSHFPGMPLAPTVDIHSSHRVKEVMGNGSDPQQSLGVAAGPNSKHPKVFATEPPETKRSSKVIG